MIYESLQLIPGIATRFLKLTNNPTIRRASIPIAATSRDYARFTPDGPRSPDIHPAQVIVRRLKTGVTVALILCIIGRWLPTRWSPISASYGPLWQRMLTQWRIIIFDVISSSYHRWRFLRCCEAIRLYHCRSIASLRTMEWCNRTIAEHCWSFYLRSA